MLRTMLMGCVLVFSLWSPGRALADKLDDFKEAANKRGCQAIPYKSERETCQEEQAKKDAQCRNFSCKRKEVEKRLETLREKRQSLADVRSRDPNNARAIADLEDVIQKLAMELKELKNYAEQARPRCESCIKARETVQRVFGNVISTIKNESDPVLKPYIDRLVEHFEQEAKEHVTPLTEVKDALAGCEWVIREINW